LIFAIEANKLFRDSTRLRQYFGLARYIQEGLLERLDKKSSERFSFVKFPDCIAPNVINHRPFDAGQIEIIKKYRAPKFLPVEAESTKPQRG
jgi:hypothetical protein